MSKQSARIETKAKSGGRIGSSLIALVFLWMGCAFCAVIGRQLYRDALTYRWPRAQCVILQSSVADDRSNESAPYRFTVRYDYEWGGRTYSSDLWSYRTPTFSEYGGAGRLAQRFPADAKSFCYVNPSDPSEALLERPGLWMGLVLLLPLTFAVVGAGMLAGIWSRSRRAVETVPPIVSSGSGPLPVQFPTNDDSSPRTLKPADSRFGAALVLGIFAVVWNGLVWGVFLRGNGLFRQGVTHWSDWVQLIFLAPFVLVGLVVFLAWIYQLLSLSNPKAELTVSSGCPRLGEQLELSWRLTGRTNRLRSIKVYLEGREEVTCRRGTRNYTDKNVFFLRELLTVEAPDDLTTGHTTVLLPMDSVPSFQSENHRIVWAIRIAGVIPRRPDLKEEFVIEARPPAALKAA